MNIKYIQSDRLRELRKKHKYTQEEMAKKVGVTTSAYGFYEQGKVTPDAEKIMKFSKMFDVSADYLLGLSDIKQRESKLTDKQIKSLLLSDLITEDELDIIVEMVCKLKKCKLKLADKEE